MRRKLIHAILAILGLLTTAAAAWAEDFQGVVTAVSGEAFIMQGGKQKVAAAIGSAVTEGDAIVTGENGRMLVLFRDNCRLSVGPATQVVIDRYVVGGKDSPRRSAFDLLWGRVRVLIGEFMTSETDSVVRTPTAVAGVSGTYFIVDHNPSRRLTRVLTLNGQVNVRGLKNKRPQYAVTRGLITSVPAGKVPSKPEEVDPGTLRELLNLTDVREEVTMERIQAAGPNEEDALRDWQSHEDEETTADEPETVEDAFEPYVEDAEPNDGMDAPTPGDGGPGDLGRLDPGPDGDGISDVLVVIHFDDGAKSLARRQGNRR